MRVLAMKAVASWPAANWLALYLPLAVRAKIKFWDRFHFVLPFSFELSTSGFLTGADWYVPPPTAPINAEAAARAVCPSLGGRVVASSWRCRVSSRGYPATQD